ncbi:hypothetical protein GOODEAATRI_031562 [Goodea atripinnis]|uniref:Uncharacterized protein n=1 Tax=Goodea atripinnis TaxID=208336 RepID=A0ABV0NPN6_9TELE
MAQGHKSKKSVNHWCKQRTHNDIMLTQHRHLPQALIGESVKVVRPVLPPRPTLGPSGLDQLICRDTEEADPEGGATVAASPFIDPWCVLFSP